MSGLGAGLDSFYEYLLKVPSLCRRRCCYYVFSLTWVACCPRESLEKVHRCIVMHIRNFVLLCIAANSGNVKRNKAPKKEQENEKNDDDNDNGDDDDARKKIRD